jgi:hypothetical protein
MMSGGAITVMHERPILLRERPICHSFGLSLTPQCQDAVNFQDETFQNLGCNNTEMVGSTE